MPWKRDLDWFKLPGPAYLRKYWLYLEMEGDKRSVLCPAAQRMDHGPSVWVLLWRKWFGPAMWDWIAR